MPRQKKRPACVPAGEPRNKGQRFRKAVFDWKEARGLSEAALARHLGMAKSSVSAWMPTEGRPVFPAVTTLQRVCTKLSLSTAYVLRGEGSPFQGQERPPVALEADVKAHILRGVREELQRESPGLRTEDLEADAAGALRDMVSAGIASARAHIAASRSNGEVAQARQDVVDVLHALVTIAGRAVPERYHELMAADIIRAVRGLSEITNRALLNSAGHVSLGVPWMLGHRTKQKPIPGLRAAVISAARGRGTSGDRSLRRHLDAMWAVEVGMGSGGQLSWLTPTAVLSRPRKG
jgi:transcriptional regulator with XRE-family HTH domain